MFRWIFRGSPVFFGGIGVIRRVREKLHAWRPAPLEFGFGFSRMGKSRASLLQESRKKSRPRWACFLANVLKEDYFAFSSATGAGLVSRRPRFSVRSPRGALFRAI